MANPPGYDENHRKAAQLQAAYSAGGDVASQGIAANAHQKIRAQRQTAEVTTDVTSANREGNRDAKAVTSEKHPSAARMTHQQIRERMGQQNTAQGQAHATPAHAQIRDAAKAPQTLAAEQAWERQINRNTQGIDR